VLNVYQQGGFLVSMSTDNGESHVTCTGYLQRIFFLFKVEWMRFLWT